MPAPLDAVKCAAYTPCVDLVGTTEIGKLLGVSRQRADQLTRTPGFPKPVSELAQGRVWRKRDVTKWIAKRRSAEL